MIVTIHPQAEAEFIDAAAYYAREADTALGEAFITEFARTIDLLIAHPKLGASWRAALRRLPMRRFPYSLVYHESATELRIIAVAHHSRRPGYWRGRS